MVNPPEPQTVEDILRGLDGAVPSSNLESGSLPPPAYEPGTGAHRLGLAVASMRDHMSDEGWQLFQALEHAGYSLRGHGLADDCVNVKIILRENPDIGTVVLQDKREWDTGHRMKRRDFRDPMARFHNVETLAQRRDIFKLTILKDAQARPEYHRRSAEEIGCNAWIIYYHPRIVQYLAPYLRPEHCVRTYHSLDRELVPEYQPERNRNVLLSGAVSSAYPLRKTLAKNLQRLPGVSQLAHPGYHRNGTNTPGFLKLLSDFKISICTSSRYGYALRKIAESTACGCVVVTDLPVDEVMPEIDDNLVRVRPDIPLLDFGRLLVKLCDEYDAERQRYYAAKAVDWYDYRVTGSRLSWEIERTRCAYSY